MRALLVLVALCCTGPPSVARAQGKTYLIKPGHKSWTKFGKSHYYKTKRPKRSLKLVRLKSGTGFVVSNPRRAWGTRLAVYRINMVMASFRQRFPKSQPVIILDMSKRGGGPVKGHMTHMDGRDVDIPLVLEGVQDITRVSQRTVDLERTWFLLKTFVDSCDVDYIFLDRALQRSLREHALKKGHTAEELGLILQYPAAERSMTGLVRHWPNHKDHMHLHFRRERNPLLPAAKRYCEWRKRKTAP